VARGSEAYWRFEAPDGTLIERAQLWRTAAKAENAWKLIARLASGGLIEEFDCTRPVHSLECRLGGPLSAQVDWPLATASLSLGIACVATPTTCAPGFSEHEVWVAIHRSVITINDPTPPTASNAGGTLLAGGYLRGNATATVGTAADGSGIKAVQVRVDGDRVVGETQLACDYTRAAPCDDVASPVTVPVVTANIGDGHWTARIGVVDAGGNFTAAATQPIVVDNGAPLAPTATSPASLATAGDTATIAWREPPSQVSAITAAHVTLCRDGACSTTTQPAGAGAGQATLRLAAGPGAYAARVSLLDAAGNHNPHHAAHWSITRTQSAAAATPAPAPARETPRPAPTRTRSSARLTLAAPKIARGRRTVSVRGSVAPGVRGRVTVSLSARVSGRARTFTRRATITQDRRYRATFTLPSSRWRSATVTARYAGSATHRSARASRTVRAR